MMRRMFLCAGCLIVLSMMAGRASADLVVNGGFETGDFTGWTLDGDDLANFVETGFTHTGDYAAWFGEVGRLGTLSQSLATTVGAQYALTFWFAGDGDSPSQFQALIDSTVLLNLVDPAFDPDYVRYSYTFTARSTSTLLSFKFRDDPFFINLDDVSVVAVPVPEPASAVMVGLGGVVGAVGLVLARLRGRPSPRRFRDMWRPGRRVGGDLSHEPRGVPGARDA